MNKTHILAIGRNVPILQTVVRLINNNPAWQGTGAVTNAEAIAAFGSGSFKLVLLCGGISEPEEQELRLAFVAHNPAIIIVQHYGGGSGLLSAEIFQAIGV